MPEKDGCHSPSLQRNGKTESEPSLNGLSTTGTECFSTAEKAKKKVMGDYREYESEPKEAVKKKVFSDEYEEEKGFVPNYEETKKKG